MTVAKAQAVDIHASNKPSGNQDIRQDISQDILISRAPSDVLWSEGQRFHDLFDDYLATIGKKEAQKRIAVEMSDSTVSFAALNTLANQIAHYLVSKDVGPGDKVAILLNRTPEAYASVLAVSKIGAVFVPLDRSFPADRVAFIIEDSSVKAVLSLTVYSNVFEGLDIEFVALDASEDEITQLPATAPAINLLGSDALAYVIYTSGTTGKPKGVQINHSSMCNFIRVAVNCYGYSPDDRVYQSLTLAFDYSFEEIWVPLLSGARLVPAPSGVNLVGEELHEFLLDKKISAYCSVPTILATIDDALPDLKLLLLLERHVRLIWRDVGRQMTDVF